MPSPVTNARRQVSRLRDALLSPGAAELECVLPALESAAAGLRSLDSSTARGAVPQLSALQLELRHAARLLQYAEALQAGRARMLGAAAGYTPSGEPAPLNPHARISVKG